MQKIAQQDHDAMEYSRLVTEKFCSLVREGKIMLQDRMIAIEALSKDMNPKTMNQYRTPNLNHYNSVKGAVEAKRLMFFKIGTEIFIPEQ